MYAPRKLSGWAAAVSIGVAALATGTAGAGATPLPPPPAPPLLTVTNGPNWLVVTVTPQSDDAPQWCRVDPFAETSRTRSLEVAATGNVFVDDVPPGTHIVSAWCPNGGATRTTVVVTG